MLRIVNIVPGCVVSYYSNGSLVEGTVLLVRDQFTLMVMQHDGFVRMISINKCRLKNPMIFNKKYGLDGELIAG